ncbi:TIGR03862 family flavoprotein [Sulfitobacter albidus]|uniref:TIGR03862 family flavoprotein n=1 Tax=Sulfitobacter albidus TaxID=2829501 RepID=A0A975JDG4_9RHOB|nr:TIGR03862 family flavoprotein [Sulfitobacter albidus]QUJ76462.1 TIGR03862 family flavoprotein [Sulfitobacter albidus]
MSRAVVIGSGPAGLMAAQALTQAGHRVTIAEAKPSAGRKFLMAGKSGLNLTKDEAPETFADTYAEASPRLRPMLAALGPQGVMDWARGLDQPVFTGTSGRVFPEAMKASPLLRAWLGRLMQDGATLRTRWRWTGWEGGALAFDTPDGAQTLDADVTILALGGASWRRLGSDGGWANTLAARGVPLAPFAPANAAVARPWSAHMAAHFGTPLKAIGLRCGPYSSRGEAILSAYGLEGGGIYSVSRGLREGHPLTLDLAPDLTADAIAARLSGPRGKASFSNHLRKRLKLDPVKRALLQELARPLPQDPGVLAAVVKALPVSDATLRPMDEAISTAGGIVWDGLTEDLEIKALPGVYAAGEMIDWEAPTGGYLITACLATGLHAGRAAAARLAAGA